MLVIIYLSSIDSGLVRECKDLQDACKFINQIGEDRINKVVITDLQPTKSDDTKGVPVTISA